ncbi:serine-rich adhesin for platelets-like [Argopecten irradians]|uniref:serine-rich adhesin for platelets-like n=1 Tax=Argopecten irradians TaxID=31199 RepID=UPI0037173D59
MTHHHFRHVVGTVCLCCNQSDTHLPNIRNMQWTENVHGIGTIPGHRSIRGPPTSIGISGENDKLIGITNHEISERFILKLQRDRERNNEAVFRSLENLPITIRHVPKSRVHSEPTFTAPNASSGAEARPPSMWSSSPREVPYPHLLNTSDVVDNAKASDKMPASKESQKILRSVPKKSKMSGPRCPHLMSLSACPKCVRVKRPRRRPDPKKEYAATVGAGIVGKDLNNQTEYTSNVNHSTLSSLNDSETNKVVYTGRFQGQQLRSSMSMKFLRKKKDLNVRLPLSESSSFDKKYARVFDSNHQLHYVNTSMLAGKRQGPFGKVFKKLPGIRANGESQHIREKTEVFAIKSVQRFNDPFPQASTVSKQADDFDMSPDPIPVQPMHSFASDITDIKHFKSSRAHTKLFDEEKATDSFANINKNTASRSNIEFTNKRPQGTIKTIKTSDISAKKSGNDSIKTIKASDTSARKSGNESQIEMVSNLKREDTENLNCRARHMTPGRIDDKECVDGNKTDYFGNDNQSMSTRSTKAAVYRDNKGKGNVAPDMQFSVRIEYKKTEDEPTPRESTLSEIVNMPRWVEKEKSNDESTAQSNTRDLVVEEETSRKQCINDVSVKDNFKIVSLSDENSHQNNHAGRRKNSGGLDEVNVSAQEMISSYNNDTKHSALTIENVCKGRGADGEGVSVSTDPTRTSPESGFITMPSDSAETDTDDMTVESKTDDTAERVNEGELKITQTTDSNSNERSDDNITKSKDNVLSGSDVTSDPIDVSSANDEPCERQSSDYSDETGGGFFVTTLDPNEQTHADNMKDLAGSDSGIAQDVY